VSDRPPNLGGGELPPVRRSLTDWFDLEEPGREGSVPAPKKYPDELRERAVRLDRDL
jgi:hypothetical protein